MLVTKVLLLNSTYYFSHEEQSVIISFVIEESELQLVINFLEELDSFEILATIYENAWCHNPEDHNYDLYCKTDNLICVCFPLK
jgi:hypothetical protein